jgi:hypothetical protein
MKLQPSYHWKPDQELPFNIFYGLGKILSFWNEDLYTFYAN